MGLQSSETGKSLSARRSTLNCLAVYKKQIIAWCALIVISTVGVALHKYVPSIRYDKTLLIVLSLLGSALSFWIILLYKKNLAIIASILTILMFLTWKPVLSIWGLLAFITAYLIRSRFLVKKGEQLSNKEEHSHIQSTMTQKVVYGSLYILCSGVTFSVDYFLFGAIDSIYKVLTILGVYNLLLAIKFMSLFEGKTKALVTFMSMTVLILANNELLLSLVFFLGVF